MPRAIETRLDAILKEHGAPDAYPGHMDWPALRADILALAARLWLSEEQLQDLWRKVIRSDVPPPPAHLLAYFVDVLLERHNGQ